jgi:hypothetical protein
MKYIFRFLTAALIASAQPAAFVLHEGTPVRLRLSRNLTSAEAKAGESVDFEVLNDVKIEDS